jgi:hypothetical protein
MLQNELVALILTVIAAVVVISYWKQILFMLLFLAIVVFCFGLYSVAVAVQG